MGVGGLASPGVWGVDGYRRGCRERIGQSVEEMWLGRFVTAQPIEANNVVIEVHLTTHETVRPKRIDRPEMTEKFQCAVLAGPAQINDAAVRRLLPAP